MKNHMANIPKMTNSELERVLSKAKDELARRDNMGKAIADIKKVLIKYKLRAEDIDWRQLDKTTKAGNKKKPSSKPNAAIKMKAKERLKPDQRSSVAPKYLNPNGKERWTGRGRTPDWVINICEQENIDIENFKIDPRFRI
jgi:DNA-binding protein H-NS